MKKKDDFAHPFFLSCVQREKQRKEKDAEREIILFAFYRLLSLANGSYFHDHLSPI
jgi:hypothetical protein